MNGENQNDDNALAAIIPADISNVSQLPTLIEAGKDVTTHTDAVSIPGGWSGFGYIITDPVDGSGVYKISGGLNGGGGAYVLGLIHGASFGLLAAGLAHTILIPQLASVFAAALVVWVAVVIAVKLVLGKEGLMCFAAGLLAGMAVGLINLGLAPGGAGIAAVMGAALLAIQALVPLPDSKTCKFTI